jgi:nucleotide-binding universal stress UspA family protein
MKNILVPIDFSAFSLSAAKTAAYFSKKLGAQLHLLHVVFAPPDWNTLPVEMQQNYPDIESRLVEAEIRLDKFAAQSLFKGVTVNTYVYSGMPYDQIIQFAQAYRMDLIVLGAHGAGESDGLFIGSTAQRVLRMASCPVLSVKKEYHASAFKHILFPSDFTENVEPTIQTVNTLADSLQADVNFLYVNTPLNFSDTHSVEKKMTQRIPAQKKVKYSRTIYNDFDMEQGILNFARNRNIDLITMVTHNRKGQPDYLLGSTETLLFHSEVPVMSVAN